MKRQVSLYEAKTNLSQLVEDAARGDEIIIAKNGKPRAKLTLIEPAETEKPKKRELGQWAKFMSPEELAYHRSEQFERDWKQWDLEIEQSFKVLQDEPREFRWPDTSSTPMPSSARKKGRSNSAPKRAKSSKTQKTRSS